MSKKDFSLLALIEIANSSAKNLALKADGLLKMSNIAGAGGIVEEFIKKTFSDLLSNRFKIVSGYIIYAEDRESNIKLSPHIDFIIVDQHVPNQILAIQEYKGKFNVVPQECVVGIFEIKKKLNKKAFTEACDHLSKIIASVNIKKDCTKCYLLGGVECNPYIISPIHSNPLLGIVSLEVERDFIPPEVQGSKNIDITFSFDGLLQLISEEGTDHIHSGRRKADIKYNYLNFANKPLNVSIALAYIVNYLSSVTGKIANVDNYYLNTSFNNQIDNLGK